MSSFTKSGLSFELSPTKDKKILRIDRVLGS